ncbi:MAG: hypothetical protein H6588_04225 [Flavobacteriales bacterium]|nr:hypothetical protein [Flavobacteriales bacterium]
MQKITIKSKIQEKVVITARIKTKAENVVVSKGFINLFDGANVTINK